MAQLKNNADILSWALSMSSKKKDRSENDENCSPNRYPASRRSEDILNFALTQSSKKQKVNNEDEAKNLDNNNDYNNYDSNDHNLNNEDETISKNLNNYSQEYNNEHNDEINIDDNNYNNNNDDTNEQPTKKELHTMLKSKLISGLEFELIDILNNASLENLLLLKGIGKKYGQNIIDLREDNFKFSSLSQIEKIGIKKTKIGEFINSNLGIILTRL